MRTRNGNVASGIASGVIGLLAATTVLADGGPSSAPPAAPSPVTQDAPADPPPDAVHPSDVISELTGLGAGTSRALARTIRWQENAIPVIKDAKLLAPAPEGRVAVIAYQISANEACVRNRAPEGRAALRAAREACRTVRGVESSIAAIRCAPAPRGADGCASTATVWVVDVPPGPDRDRQRYREDVAVMRITARDLDGDPAPELLIDFIRDSSYVDLADVRSGGDVFSSRHEAIAIDSDGAVLARAELRSLEYDSLALDGTSVLARVRGEEIRFAFAECEDPAQCAPEWRTAQPLAREPVTRPTEPLLAVE